MLIIHTLEQIKYFIIYHYNSGTDDRNYFCKHMFYPIIGERFSFYEGKKIPYPQNEAANRQPHFR